MHEFIVIFIKQFKAILGVLGAGSPNAWHPHAPLGHVSSPPIMYSKVWGNFLFFLKECKESSYCCCCSFEEVLHDPFLLGGFSKHLV
jgi:hypothetical protein